MKNQSLLRAGAFIALIIVGVFSGCGGIREAYRAGYDDSIGRAKETIAVQSLKTIALEQRIYRGGMGRGSYGTFEQLVKAGSLDERFASTSPVIEDYKFTMQLAPASDNQPAMFKINADPYQADSSSITGKLHFYTDSNGSIHVNDKQAATAQDPVYQP